MITHVSTHPLLEPHPMPSLQERAELAAKLRQMPGQVVPLAALKTSGTARQAAYAVRCASNGMLMFGPAGSFDSSTTTMFGRTWIFISYVGKAT